MKVTGKLKLLCSQCKYYRTIVNADGGCAMGCLKVSTNGYPVDIRNMEACPRTQRNRQKIDVEPSELLSVLGKIYAECAPHPMHLALYQYLSDGGATVKRYRDSIGRALTAMEILKVVSVGVEGKRGNNRIYRWNLKKYGPPSLELVDKIINTMSETIEDDKLERLAKTLSSEVPRSRTLEVNEGVTVCEMCWLKDVTDCRQRLLVMGLDCKKVNINTIRYGKSSVGQQGEDAEGR